MSEYTPPTENVRNGYVYSCGDSERNDEYSAEFDRWLKAHDARVWREGAMWGIEEIEGDFRFQFVPGDNPYED
jgi:hypothetical protein